jgi:hypothetical protein
MLINSPNISGSLRVTGNTVITGSLTVAGGINATITGSATTASYVEYSNVANRPALVSSSAQIVGYNIFATTGSNSFNGAQTVTGSFTVVTGSVVELQVTNTGVNIGNVTTDNHNVTGSLRVSGSFTVTTTGTELQVTNTGVNLGNTVTDIHNVTGSLRVSGSMTAVNAILSGTGDTFSDGLRINRTTSNSTQYTLINHTGGATNIVSVDQSGNNIAEIYFGRSINGSIISNSMMINKDGNVGIGTTNPDNKLAVWGTNNGLDSSQGNINVYTTDTATINTGGSIGLGGYYTGTSQAIPFGNITGKKENSSSSDAAGYLAFLTRNSATGTGERMRITSGGNVGVNTTNPGYKMQVNSPVGDWGLHVKGVTTASSSYGLFIDAGTNNNDNAFLIRSGDSTRVMYFLRGDGLINTGTSSGSPYNNTSGASANMVVNSQGTLERSTSSLKYKTDIEDYDKGLAEVMQMRPVYYKSINEREKDLTFAGLIAEEIEELGLTEFVQYAEDGTPDALSYQNMIALLVKSIQEQQTQIETLKSKIEILEQS